MIVAIADTGAGTQNVRLFMEGASVAEAISAYCNEYNPPKDPAAFVGVDTGWAPNAPELFMPWAIDGGVLVERLQDIQDDLVSQIKDHHYHKRLALDVRFEYPAGSGKWFSASLLSENNWGNFSSAAQWPLPSLVYPIDVPTYDNRQEVSVTDAATLQAMLDALWVVVMQERGLAKVAISGVLQSSTGDDARAAAEGYLQS